MGDPDAMHAGHWAPYPFHSHRYTEEERRKKKKKTYKKVVEEEMTCRSNNIKHACYTQMRSLASCVSKSCRADTQPTGHRASRGYAFGQSVVGGQAGPWQ